MIHYGEDERGRIFRWDVGLRAWIRITSDDEEYDVALRAERAVARRGGSFCGRGTAVR